MELRFYIWNHAKADPQSRLAASGPDSKKKPRRKVGGALYGVVTEVGEDCGPQATGQGIGRSWGSASCTLRISYPYNNQSSYRFPLTVSCGNNFNLLDQIVCVNIIYIPKVNMLFGLQPNSSHAVFGSYLELN